MRHLALGTVFGQPSGCWERGQQVLGMPHLQPSVTQVPTTLPWAGPHTGTAHLLEHTLLSARGVLYAIQVGSAQKDSEC